MAEMKSACAFCDIASGETKSEVVFENETCIAFLDYRPLFPGHCLLIPRKHYETLLDLPDELIQPLFLSTKLLVSAVQAACAAEGSFVAMNNTISQSVPHLHVHIVPRKKGDGLKGFFWPRHKYKDEEAMQAIAEKIRMEVARLS